jgi:XTP/dITP diphosphohydrolase
MKFIIATNNPKKRVELERILAPLHIEAVTAAQAGVNLDEVEETGATFEENAELKARAASALSGLPAVADDSGLEVDALGGAPGVFSARYAGENATDADRVEKLLRNLENVPQEKRGARFVSAVCCVFPDGKILTVRGECAGRIAFSPRGGGGFGYDPVFELPDGRTYSELSDEEKDAVSHRGVALRRLADELKKTI